MAHILEDLLLRIPLAPLEHLQGQNPNQRDRRDERAQPPRQAPGLRQHDHQKQPRHPRRRARRLPRRHRLAPAGQRQRSGLDARLVAAVTGLGA